MAGGRLAGEWCNFRWFQASDLSLGALVEAVPELVHDRLVVVTSFDSGPLRLTLDDVASGWQQSGFLAISPKSPSPSSLPLGEWDEWYVFEEMPSARSPEVFINYGEFSLRPDPGNEWQQAALERFWGQLAEWLPESYLAEGDNLICVTRAEWLVPALARYFEAGEGQARTSRCT
jgi:hypothetical protein